jgi:16S rRNA (cytidine1402-2'-O)-methyltransferase
MEKKQGKLSIISTPIGNLQDITLRALNTIKEADIIAAEDTRHSLRLLKHFDISKKMYSCHAYNEHKTVNGILRQITDFGLHVAVLSDAGTPVIADPGFHIIREARKLGIEPEFIPGVSALTFAAAASGLPADKFSFFGFAPVKKGKRETLLNQIKEEKRTAFLFESPYRVQKLLTAIKEVIGPETEVSIVREATKLHEEIITGQVSKILEETETKNWKGEFVIGIYPNSKN